MYRIAVCTLQNCHIDVGRADVLMSSSARVGASRERQPAAGPMDPDVWTTSSPETREGDGSNGWPLTSSKDKGSGARVSSAAAGQESLVAQKTLRTLRTAAAEEDEQSKRRAGEGGRGEG